MMYRAVGILRFAGVILGNLALGLLGGLAAGLFLDIAGLCVLILLRMAGLPGTEWAMDQLSEPASLQVLLRITGCVGILVGLYRGLVKAGSLSASTKATVLR